MKSRQWKNEYGEWGCVIGAAEGLGAAFCEELAELGVNLIMVDKDEERLKETSALVVKKYTVTCQNLLIDLNDGQASISIKHVLEDKNCRFILYNAAYGPVKAFEQNSYEEFDRYLKVNAEQPLKLAHWLVKQHSHHRSGFLFVASLAGFRGTQLVAPYSATKAFIWNLAEALFYEYQQTKVEISVCCPGPIDTPNYRASKPKLLRMVPKAMEPQQVAHETIQKFGKQLFIIPGSSNKVSHFLFTRILPRKWASTIHNRIIGKMYG